MTSFPKFKTMLMKFLEKICPIKMLMYLITLIFYNHFSLLYTKYVQIKLQADCIK